jgi:disulfide bond formation protein DsbB
MRNFLKHHLHYLAWTTALVAMGGSLFFSNVLGYPPCVLCWYQRIFLYPLVFILGTGILRRDHNMYYYALPLALIGWGISIYHNLLYFKIIPESLAPCVAGISCTTKFIEYFGFITIPFLSFLAFTVIIISLIAYRKLNKYE